LARLKRIDVADFRKWCRKSLSDFVARFFGVGYGSSLSWDLDLPIETADRLQLPVLPIYSFYPGDYRSRDKVMPERMPHIRVNALFVRTTLTGTDASVR